MHDANQPRLLGGRYELDGIVGRGGMAEVFRARDIRLDRIVAVKTLRDDLARDQTFQARFRREAQSAASLNHPAIVAVYDTGEDMVGATAVPYIVMEYVDGSTLRDLLRDGRRLLPERAAEITDGVLRALDYSHRHGIVHRDIKPGNVMLTRSGEIKVMDFGIARAVSDTQSTMTQTAQVIGTAQYLSPEQARGDRVDYRSDLYSAGCLLYELLTGRPPFSGDSPVAIAYQHVRENPVPPTRVDPEVPPWGDWIVLKAMAKDPAARYQSAADMRADIQRALSGVPVAAPTRAEYAGTRRMGTRTQLAGPTSAIPAYDYEPPDDEPPGEPQRRGRAWPWLLALLIAVLLIGGGYGLYRYVTGTSGDVSVPTVRGKTLHAAEAAIRRAHLKVGTISNVSSAAIAKGDVVRTSPAGGQSAARNSAVALFVSAGRGRVTVPPLSGQRESAAENALRRLGLNPRPHKVTSLRPAGTVTGTSPPGGTRVARGAAVTLDVSAGGAAVPNVVGEAKAQATSTLRNDGFKVSPVTARPPAGSGFGPGQVFMVRPGAGTVERPGTVVTIYVAKGPAPSPPPTSPPPTSPPPTSPPPTSPPPTSPPPTSPPPTSPPPTAPPP